VTTWLVTGGAGYIGAHVVRALQSSGRGVVVLDDLSSGVRQNVPDDVPLIVASVADREVATAALREHHIDGVIHLAAKKAAGESVNMPLYYYEENVQGMQSLLASMNDVGVTNLVYSSSAAVYGTPVSNPISEGAPLAPESPYGETKVVGEWLARGMGIAHGFSWLALRYFNVAGAGSDNLGDRSVNNLVPMVFQAVSNDERPKVFGADYPTSDGSCIRDYVHVSDLAGAHVAAATRCETGVRAEVFNVGRGQGSSVFEVMDMISEVLGSDVNAEIVARRAGDPAANFAATGLIEAELGWRATLGLREMVESAWSAWQATHR
jgi:UDP-glucose 4-epimerase